MTVLQVFPDAAPGISVKPRRMRKLDARLITRPYAQRWCLYSGIAPTAAGANEVTNLVGARVALLSCLDSGTSLPGVFKGPLIEEILSFCGHLGGESFIERLMSWQPC
jgi:hypothetical protein